MSADLAADFRTTDVARCITDGGFKRVALQFPDGLLAWAPSVAAELGRRLDGGAAGGEQRPLVFVLGDTSYGACCVDEVAAEHLQADLVVHFGPACLSATRRLPAFYVVMEVERRTGVEEVPGVEALVEVVRRRSDAGSNGSVAVLYDMELHSLVEEWKGDEMEWGNVALDWARPVANLSQVVQPEHAGQHQGLADVKRAGALVFNSSADYFVWLRRGRETSMALRNFLLLQASGPEASSNLDRIGLYDIDTQVVDWLEDSPQNATTPRSLYRALGQRFAMVEKIRNADRIGILAGTLVVSGVLETMAKCRRLIQEAGKRCYSFVVGKPNPAKLGNFPDMDVFVLLSCPENSLLLGSKDYLQPIASPFELEVALSEAGDRLWNEKPYSTTFDQVKDLDEPPGATVAESALQARSQEWSLGVSGSTGASAFLKGRTWQGLRYEGDEPTAATRATEGRSGIAAGYSNEQSASTRGA